MKPIYNNYKDEIVLLIVIHMVEENDFKKRIMEEMGSNAGNILERNFETAKMYIKIGADGKIVVENKERLNLKQRVLLYLIGKHYAKEAGVVESEYVENEELLNELGISLGSLLPTVMELRKDPGIKQKKDGRMTQHAIPINLIEKELRRVVTKSKTDIESL